MAMSVAILMLLPQGIGHADDPRAKSPSGDAGINAEERAVLAANLRFYRAFDGRDMKAMDALWARGVPVAVIHPAWPGITGRTEVMESWKSILSSETAPRIRAVNANAHVYGSTAFVICYEIVNEGAVLIATNIFAKRGGAWKMVHHQAGPTTNPNAIGEKT